MNNVLCLKQRRKHCGKRRKCQFVPCFKDLLFLGCLKSGHDKQITKFRNRLDRAVNAPQLFTKRQNFGLDQMKAFAETI